MSVYDELAAMLREIAEDHPNAEFYLINPTDAEQLSLETKVDDKTGEHYLDIAGFKVIPSDICEEGEVGACFSDEPDPRLTVTKIGSA